MVYKYVLETRGIKGTSPYSYREPGDKNSCFVKSTPLAVLLRCFVQKRSYIQKWNRDLSEKNRIAKEKPRIFKSKRDYSKGNINMWYEYFRIEMNLSQMSTINKIIIFNLEIYEKFCSHAFSSKYIFYYYGNSISKVFFDKFFVIEFLSIYTQKESFPIFLPQI